MGKRAFEELADVSGVLQPLPSTKRHNNVTITVFSLHSACLFAFGSLVL